MDRFIRTRDDGNLLRLKAQSGAGGAAVPWLFALIPQVRKHIRLQHVGEYRCQEHYRQISFKNGELNGETY